MEWLLILGIGYLFAKGAKAAAASSPIPEMSVAAPDISTPVQISASSPAAPYAQMPAPQPAISSAQDLSQYEIQATNIAASGSSLNDQTDQLQALYDQAKLDPALSPGDLQNLWDYMLGVVS